MAALRLWIACAVLIIVPVLGMVGYKVYQQIQLENQKTQVQWHVARGEVLFFNASWCGPCKQIKPVVAQMRKQGYRMRDIDIDQNHGLAAQYGIRSVPTFVFLEGGSEVNRFSGASAEKLRQLSASPLYH